MKKFLSIMFLFLLSWTISFAYQGSLPEIYISDLNINKTIYASGDKITGTFVIKNLDTIVATDIYYEIKLTGDYKDTIARKVYSRSSMNGPLTLGARENRTISFEYSLPKNLAGKGFGIQIQSMLQNGIGMGWKDAFFDIAGKSEFISLKNVYITTSASSTRKYFLQEGPTVYREEKAYLNIEFNNTENTLQEIHPKLTIYDRSEAKDTLLVEELPVIKAKAEFLTKSKIELPTFDYVPRVYVGKLEFLNKEGEQISTTLDFRYIVFGQMVTINNVISDKEYAEKGELVNVAVDITGAPFDVNTLLTATLEFYFELQHLS